MCTIMHRLCLSILDLELFLHIEIGLSLPFDPLLLHISDNPGVHGLWKWLARARGCCVQDGN